MSAQRESTPNVLLTAVVPFVVVAIIVACGTEPPTSIKRSQIGVVGLAKPAGCNASTNLVIKIGSGPAITSDGGSYAEGVGGVGAHVNGPTGNLMLTVANAAPRVIGYASSAGSGNSNDRLYTNSHTNPGGSNACGFGPTGLPVGATGSAVLEFELSTALKAEVIRYGKNCGGSAVAGTRVTTTHPDNDTWTIAGTSGVHCRPKAKGNGMDQIGTTGAFSMTLVRQ
jgi:hypothetical protein